MSSAATQIGRKGRPAKYHKPNARTYRVSDAFLERVEELRSSSPTCRSDSDVVEEVVLRAHQALKALRPIESNSRSVPAAPRPGPRPSRIQTRYLTVEDAADYMGLTPDALRARVKKRNIAFIKDGKRVMFDRVDLDAHMRARRVPSRDEVFGGEP
jgi:excisionase family DNA binding protein